MNVDRNEVGQLLSMDEMEHVHGGFETALSPGAACTVQMSLLSGERSIIGGAGAGGEYIPAERVAATICQAMPG